jgi:hypothetical protein
VIAILIDPQGFGHLNSNERLTADLSVSGIPTYLVREGDDLSQVLARPYAHAFTRVGRTI